MSETHTNSEAISPGPDRITLEGERHRCYVTVGMCPGCANYAEGLARGARERENLLTVMRAAADEIAEYWDAHCDPRGYGPVNLMRRLERGTATAEYPAYSTAMFNAMWKRLSVEQRKEAMAEAERNKPKERPHD